MTDPTTTDDYAVRVLSISGAMCGTCGDEPGDQNCADCERVRRGYIADLRAAGWAPAVSAVSLPPADQTALRDRIADAIAGVDAGSWGTETKAMHPYWRKVYQSYADAVLAVLPATTDQTADLADWEAMAERTGRLRKTTKELLDRAEELEARVAQLSVDRAAVLGEAADRLSQKAAALTEGLHGLAHFVAKDRLREAKILDREAAELRRMADETQPAETEAHPAEHRWAAELYDPLADEWVPGTRYLVRDDAVNHLNHASKIGPLWKDGTPTQRRLVHVTTAYTVEQLAAGARQDGAQQ
jgi:hypothetical protein